MTEPQSTVAIVGGGAMGGLWAGRLATAGHAVSILDVSPALLRAIEADGMTVREASGDLHVRVVATDDAAAIGVVDFVIVFVKGPHTAAAAVGLLPLLGAETVVATLQNGWGNADLLAERVDPGRLVIGVTYEGATVESPGIVRHPGSGPTYVGPYVEGGAADPAEQFGDLLRSGGFDAMSAPAVRTDIWRKLIHNSACLPVAALTGLRASALISVAPACDLVDALTRECVTVAQALGHDIVLEERIERIHAVLSAAGDGIPSMLADAQAQRPTEIETINGAVVRAAAGLGLDTPLNRAMVDLVHAMEAAWAR